jgi:transposase InsO family protein
MSLYLALNDIEHRKTKVGSPRTNGFVERFNGTVLEEFFRPTMRSQLYQNVDALQADLDAWLHHYNHERPPSATATRAAVLGRPWSASSASHPQDKEVKKTFQVHLGAVAIELDLVNAALAS